MTVRELIEALEKEDGDKVVILQKDAEGNGYSPLWGVDGFCMYRPYNTYSGEVGIPSLDTHHRNYGYTEEDVYADEGDEAAVVLFPVN